MRVRGRVLPTRQSFCVPRGSSCGRLQFVRPWNVVTYKQSSWPLETRVVHATSRSSASEPVFSSKEGNGVGSHDPVPSPSPKEGNGLGPQGPVRQPIPRPGNPLGTHGPWLPPRRPAKPGDGSGKKSGGDKKDGRGGAGGDGGKGPGRATDRKLAQLAAYSGLVGTTAIALANLSGIDIWAEFRWTSMEDLQLAVLATLPLQLLNGALLLPSFGSDTFPGLKKAGPEAGGRGERLPGAEDSGAAPRGAGQSEAPADAGVVAAAGPSAIAAAASSAAAAPSSAAPVAVARTDPAGQEQAGTSAASGVRQEAQPPVGALPAAAWGTGGGGGGGGWRTPWGGDLSTLQSALNMAQGYYVHNNPTARLTPAVEAAVAFVDSAAGEMLYRGVMLTWLARWLEDRVYEGGLDELVTDQLPAAAARLGAPGAAEALSGLGVFGLCECAVAAAVAAYVVSSVVWKSHMAARRLELVLAAVTSAAEKGSRKAAAKAGARSPVGASKGGSGSKGASADGGAAAAGAKMPPGLVSMAFGPGAPPMDVSLAGRVMRDAAAIQATRDAAQVLLLNGVFIATGGNLAASYAAALANQLAISAMQRRAMRRLRKRNLAVARELREMAAAAAAKAAASAATAAAATAAAAPSTRQDTEQGKADVADEDGAAPSALAIKSGAGAEVSTPAAQTTAHSTAAAGVSADSTGSNGNGSPEGGRSGGSASGSGSLGRALAMLEQLVPEPPGPAKQARGGRPEQAPGKP